MGASWTRVLSLSSTLLVVWVMLTGAGRERGTGTATVPLRVAEVVTMDAADAMTMMTVAAVTEVAGMTAMMIIVAGTVALAGTGGAEATAAVADVAGLGLAVREDTVTGAVPLRPITGGTAMTTATVMDVAAALIGTIVTVAAVVARTGTIVEIAIVVIALKWNAHC